MDEIRIENLEVYAGHGVFAEETRNGQRFFINAVLRQDLHLAGETDELALSTHYGEVCAFMNRYMKQHTYKLIEAAAEHLICELLLEFPLIDRVELELRKPFAPVGLPVSDISVKMERGWETAYIGVGSNMGERQSYIEEAVQRLEKNPRIRDVRKSLLRVTTPYGGVEQEDFLNGAVGFRTLLSPMELLAFLQKLEQEAGRERKIHWGPRTLDLDVLFYADRIITDPFLTVPHPDMENRQFVLEPLNEICPYMIHPVLHKSVKQMWTELQEKAAKAPVKRDAE